MYAYTWVQKKEGKKRYGNWVEKIKGNPKLGNQLHKEGRTGQELLATSHRGDAWTPRSLHVTGLYICELFTFYDRLATNKRPRECSSEGGDQQRFQSRQMG
jgi:hypothetical protein